MTCTPPAITLTRLSPLCCDVEGTLFLKGFCATTVLVESVLSPETGKLLVYASSFASRGRRLRLVSLAVEKTAAMLKMGVEVRVFTKRFTPIYVYYKYGDEEPVPLYCNSGRELRFEDAYAALRRMMFVLSFHPKYSALRQARKEITLPA
jgi:hypothetical protein